MADTPRTIPALQGIFADGQAAGSITPQDVRDFVVSVEAFDATKAPLDSPTFTGTPAAPTATAGTNTTQLATTAFVTAAVAAGGGGGGALDDLTDVNAPTPADGDVLTWDDTAGEWVPAAPTGGGGGGALVDLTDVDDTGLDNGDVPTWDSVSSTFKMAPPVDLEAGALPSDVLRTGAGTATIVWPSEPWTVMPLTDVGPHTGQTINDGDPQGPTYKAGSNPIGHAELFSVRVAAGGSLTVTTTATDASFPYFKIYTAAGVFVAAHSGTHPTFSATFTAASSTEYLIEVYQGNNGETTNYTLTLSGAATIDDSPSVPGNLSALSPPVATLTDGATITWATLGRPVVNAKVTLAGNRTLAITGSPSGQRGTLLVTQDGTGSRTLTLPAGSIEEGGALTLSTAAGAKDLLEYLYDGTNFWWSIRAAYA